MEGLEELEEAVKLVHIKFRELSRSLMRIGSIKAVEKYIASPKFEEDACNYCRDIGWKEPV